ncbi:MAG TPA: hypothetical protein VGM39_16170 [Kofleriaceae bacterium]
MIELPKVVERSITLRAGESVVAVRHRSDQDWALLTTQRLRWFLDGTLTDVAVARIIERKLIEPKGKPRVMRFVSSDGEQHDIAYDEGGELSAFWSAVTSSIPAKQG